jgi:hypothetical protein
MRKAERMRVFAWLKGGTLLKKSAKWVLGLEGHMAARRAPWLTRRSVNNLFQFQLEGTVFIYFLL